jgi:hypothetical protein
MSNTKRYPDYTTMNVPVHSPLNKLFMTSSLVEDITFKIRQSHVSPQAHHCTAKVLGVKVPAGSAAWLAF